MTTSKDIARLLYADAESCADMLYFGKFFAPDPFIALSVKGKKVAVLNKLEYHRAQVESQFDEILALEDYLARARKRFKQEAIGPAEVIRLLAKDYGLSGFHIADDFPAGIAFELRRVGLKVEIQPAPFFPERLLKDDDEVTALKKSNAASAAGLKVADGILHEAVIKRGKLYFEGKVLTSEYLRYRVEAACLEAGAMPNRTIVAGGDQACDPHCIGFGPLKAHELIIVDVFPRMTTTGYYGDMTRTFLKGRASEEQKHLVTTVATAQKRAIAMVKNAVEANAVHASVENYFEEKGYITGCEGGVHTGFFHSTGHGLGLDIHECPRLSPSGPRLRTGMVVTVEPGLYYPGLGGCRIEDVIRVSPTGADKLSKFHYRWLIP